MASRNIQDLTPECQIKYSHFMKKMADAGHHYTVTCTARKVIEQVALFSQGRETLDHTNYLRRLAGMPMLDYVQNLKRVTWTLHSKHLINLDDSDPTNDKATAFDIACHNEFGEICWDVKVDVDHDHIPDYEEAGKIGESCGLTWGGRFKNKWGTLQPDYPHFQDDEVYTKKERKE
jgi:hypothetical protein